MCLISGDVCICFLVMILRCFSHLQTKHKRQNKKASRRNVSNVENSRRHFSSLSTSLVYNHFTKTWSRLIFRMKAVIFIHVLYLILIRTFTVKGVTKCESRVELRAVLLSCPTKDTGCDDDDPLSQAMNAEESQILQASPRNFEMLKEEKERGFPNLVKDCKRKLVITLKVKNSGKIPCDDEYIVIDHVFDPVTGGKGRLLSPVVLKLRQEQMVQLYGLQFQRVVNSDPFEEQKEGSKVCSVSPENPTCGIATYNGKPIPYSEGFCCSHDPSVNAKRQLSQPPPGDSFLYRDYKQFSRGNNRFVREEIRPNVIVNPKLLKLESFKDRKLSDDCTVEKDDGKDECSPLKELTSDKIPNFFFELDRKIMCQKGDFLSELCKLRDEKYDQRQENSSCSSCDTISNTTNKENIVYGYSNAKYFVNNKQYRGSENNIYDIKMTNSKVKPSKIHISDSSNLNKKNLNNAAPPKSINRALNLDESTSSRSLNYKKPGIYDSIKSIQGSRGKRESRQDTKAMRSGKKLTLEEKLEKFAKMKHHLANRGKRLLELSHKRFKKAEIRCRNAEQCRAIIVTNFPEEDYVKVPPPKYFFSHDKFIIDPAEPRQQACNMSCSSPIEIEYEDSSDAEENKPKGLCKFGKKKKGNCANKKAPNDDTFLTSPESIKKCEERMRNKECSDKINSKKERVSHNMGGNIENIRDKMKNKNCESTNKEKCSSLFEKKYKTEDQNEDVKEFEDAKKNEKGEKKGEKIILTEIDQELRKSSKAHLNVKHPKNFLTKGENERTSKPKIRNFFLSRNRENKNVGTELVKEQKCSNVNSNGENVTDKINDGSEGEKSQKINQNDCVNEIKPKTEKEQNEIKIVSVTQCTNGNGNSAVPDETDPEKIRYSGNHEETTQTQKETVDENSENERKQESENEERKHLKRPIKQQNHIIHPINRGADDEMGGIDFNVEIIRNQQPQEPVQRFHPSSPVDFLRNHVNAHHYPPITKAYGLLKDGDRKTLHSKKFQNPFVYYKSTPQRYYVLQNDRFKYPHEVYLLQEPKGPLIELKNRKVFTKMFDRPQYELPNRELTEKLNRLRYDNYMHQKPVKQYYPPFINHNIMNQDSKIQKKPVVKQAYFRNSENSKTNAYESQYGNYPEIFFRKHENPSKLKYDQYDETDDDVEKSNREKIRRKRATEYSFEPAKGFYGSQIKSLKTEETDRLKDTNIVHELENCSLDRKVRKSEETETPAEKISDWHLKDKSGFDSEIFSKLVELQKKLNHLSDKSQKDESSTMVASTVDRNAEKKAKGKSDKERLILSYMNAPDYVLKEMEAEVKGKREANDPIKLESPKTGQTCDKESSGDQDVARCMRFGDLWYSVYLIKKPVIAQIVGVQLFDRHALCDGTCQWRDLTKGKMVRLGTFLPKAEDELPSISMSFMGGKTKRVQSAIDPDNYLLLIPSHVSDPSKTNFYPQFEGGPSEYLLVESKDVSQGGDCNMIGTSFEAFSHQTDRCSQQKGSCFKRQPVDLWREDMEARIRGKRGKYFVENFGTIPNSPVRSYTNISGEFLALEYYGEYTSTIEIEVKADYNAVVRKGSNAQIPSVYIDSTFPKKTRIILSVLNIGLTSSYFRPRLGDCPPDLDPAWCPLEGPLVTIPPQQRRDFKLDLSGVLPTTKIFATVQVLNQLNKQIAHRKVVIKKGDRCICAFHCKCNCIGNLIAGRTCRRLTLEEYRSAGYIGSFPFRGGVVTSATESIFKNICQVLATTFYILLFFGILKGILGIFMRRLGISGTRVIVGPRKLSRYYEYELQCCTVLFDDCGFPVHPTTCMPVQIVPLWVEVLLNFFFFFLYPLRGIWFLCFSLPCCKTVCGDCDGCNRHEGGFDFDQKRPLLSKNPQPTCFNYNLTTLKNTKGKAEEFLPYLPYKGDDDPLEEDDTEFVLQEMKRYRKK